MTSESLLDYASLKQHEGETYHQFIDRLLSHAWLHLPEAGVTFDRISSGQTGKHMTRSLMNFAAIDWLQKINPRLINIIKTEYSREVREDVRLAALPWFLEYLMILRTYWSDMMLWEILIIFH